MERYFKPVPGFEGVYSVSDDGRVMRHRTRTRNGVGYYWLPEREIPPTPTTNGYLVVNLWRENKSTRFLVHRLVMLAFAGPSELSVDHINGITSDNRLENLRYCSLSLNTRFQHLAGRSVAPLGEQNGKSRLKMEQVIAIKNELARGRSQSSLGREYDVSKGAIAAISTGRSWSHVKVE